MTAPPWSNKSTVLAMKQMNRIPTGPVYYNSQNTLQILFQLHGSIWWKVLPYCLVNVMIMVALHFFNRHYDGYLRLTLGQNSTMHTFGGIIVSFLCISRLSSSLQGYNDCREYISIMFRETRELMMKGIVYSKSASTQYGNDDNDKRQKAYDQKEDEDEEQEATNLWRIELIYRTLLLLRTTVINIEFPYRKFPAYQLKELGDPLNPSYEYQCVQPPPRTFLKQYSIPQSVALDSFRVPLRMEQLLRETISNQKYVLHNRKSKSKISDNNNSNNNNNSGSPLMVIHEEMNLHASVDQFMIAFYGIRKFMTTPIPFPLVQMAHTIGLLYVFTLPLVFLRDKEANLIEDCFNIFLLTYGFYGVMITSIVLDDPFASAHDANCFDVDTYSLNAIDDALILVLGMCSNNNMKEGNKYCQLLHTKMNLNNLATTNIGQETINKEQHDHDNVNNNHTKNGMLNGYKNNNNNTNNYNTDTSYGSTTNNDDETGLQQKQQSLLHQSVQYRDSASATVPAWM